MKSDVEKEVIDVTEADMHIKRLTDALKHDPHAVLGIHSYGDKKIIRLYRPEAKVVFFEYRGKTVQAHKTHEAGLFEYIVDNDTQVKDYRVYHQNGLLTHDPYAFFPTFGETDQYLFAKGTHYNIHRRMGARLATHQGIEGVAFTVWAPSAKGVALVADCNFFDGRQNPMRSLGASGVWELFVPGLKIGEKYKFEIVTQM
ncbi:MAG TPA: hypothetical protein VN457_01050, partial [Chlamydiales bacterium]|nr:hypothetical protein [Chlamydiales bacterium]